MISLQSCVRKGKHTLHRWLMDPRTHTVLRAAGYLLASFLLSAASLGNVPLPLSLALVVACDRWQALLAAVGGCVGYLTFWGKDGYVCLIWLGLGLAAALLTGSSKRPGELLSPAVAGLITAACGVLFQLLREDAPSVLLYFLQVALAAAGSWLFCRVQRGRNPMLDWLTYGVGVLALAQIMPIPYVGLGYIAAGALVNSSAFPAAALAGLALDLAQVTPVPMTAVTACACLLRLLPRYPKWLCAFAPCTLYVTFMGLCGQWDLYPLPGLLIGSVVGVFLPGPTRTSYRRGETGVAQVRLEMAAGVLSQTRQLLLEVPETAVDEDALVVRAAERACSTCPYRKTCKDSKRIAMLSGVLLHKPLLQPEELPIACRKSGRFLAELHRSQEQLCSILSDRERQREYRAALQQQYGFLTEFLRGLSDQLAKKHLPQVAVYGPRVYCCGNRPQWQNGDRCLRFPGVGCRYYVILCDGMGTGPGAVQEGKTAAQMLRRLLSAGYPAEHALKSLNSLCALRERAGAVTVDMLELQLDTGKATLYKWGAAPSYLVSALGAEKLGTAGPPPGLSVTDGETLTISLSLRRGQTLILASDGIPEEEALRCSAEHRSADPEELAQILLSCARMGGEDDATVIAVSLTGTGG